MAAVRVAMTVWQNEDRPRSLAELIDEAFDRLDSGLARPSPR
jgi:hypothetical protein